MKNSMVWALLATLLTASASAQYFGQNKVQYHRFHWEVIHSDHFDVHYYGDTREAALDATRLAERCYFELAELFGYEVREPIPLLLYASHGHFAETNITPSLISEGTGGVTELIKRRVFLPFTGSYAELSHVLKHELVHAFQIDRLLGSGKSLLGSQVVFPPLWLIEGMAEFYSIGEVDPNTEMWLRDGALNGYLVDLPTLANVGDIRVYRFGQSILAFIAERYGIEKVGELWTRVMSQTPFEKSVERTLGMSVEDLSRKWQLHVRRTYLPQLEGREAPAEAGRLLVGGPESHANYNLAPSLSPGGNRLAFISDESMFIDLCVRSDEGDIKRLAKGERSGTFESLRFLSTSMSWSPDGKLIAVSVKSGGKEGIYLLDSETGRITQRIFPDLDGIQGPAFSPDGNHLAFVGFSGGQSDLYLYELASEEVTRLTADRLAERDPAWSPDGSRLAFATDRSPYTDFHTMTIADWGIGIMSLDDGSVEMLPRLPGKNIDPSFSPDGRYLAFVSDADGIPNLYLWDLDSRLVGKITNVFTGVGGLTESSPCLSWAQEADRIAFSSFEGGRWNIYSVDAPVERVSEWTEAPEMKALTTPVLAELPDTTDFAISRYRVRFSPDYLAGGAIYAQNLGLAGESYVSLSDVLGNHTITIGAALYGSLTDSDLLLGYTNLARRLNWGVALYQYRNDYLLFEASDSDEYIRNIYRGGELGLTWPFSRFSRVECNVALLSIHQRTYKRFIWDPYYLYEVDRDNYYYAEPSVAWVTDNTFWGYTGPISGRRTRVEFSAAAGDLRFRTGVADLRRYVNISREYLFAFRGVFGFSDGDTPQRFSIGGSQSLRGYGSGSLSGTRAFLANAEFRFPLVHRLWLGFPLPLDIRDIRGCVFLDGGSAWDNGSVSFFTKDEETRLPKTKDLLASYGFGARLNLGIFVLKYDLARRTDLVSSTGSWKSLWTLGAEF
ncbi:PD40 domain-containing protein [Candidatus Fermentibacteria bacterium]|nr:PD40 domain-containing protein [Candidatus Fermentibacteria bacterium]